MLFGRYTREECGLPQKNADTFGGGMGAGKTLALLVLLAAAAWTGGRLHANHRELWVRQLPSLIAQTGDNAELRSGLLRRGAMFAAALPERTRVRRDLAFAVLTAAEYAPRRLGYIGNALTLLEGAEAPADEAPLETLAREMALSGLHEEAGEYGKAFAALDRAEKALSGLASGADGEKSERAFRLLLVNAQAYYLAMAEKGEGGDDARALELSRLAVSSRDELPGGGFASESAAFVDTLATARFENSLVDEAVLAQRLALGLADSRGLEIYLKHFDKFTSTASKGESHVQ
jgi:hypothetical protein